MHIYAEPGAYQVKLIARNNEFIDSVMHYVEVEGIRAISSNKGGNGGVATVNIYGGRLNEVSKVTLQKNGIDIVVNDTVFLIEPGNLCVRFNLEGQQAGTYDVKIYSSHANYFSASGFEVINSNTIDNNNLSNYLDFQIIGNNILLADRWQTVTFTVKNKVVNDIYAIPLNIEIKANDNSGILLFGGLENDSIWEVYKDSIDLYMETITNNERTLLYPLFIPILNANGDFKVEFKIKSSQRIDINAYLGNISYLDNNIKKAKSEDPATCLLKSAWLAFGAAGYGAAEEYFKLVDDFESFSKIWYDIFDITITSNQYGISQVTGKQWGNLYRDAARTVYTVLKAYKIPAKFIKNGVEGFLVGVRDPLNNQYISDRVGSCLGDLTHDLFNDPNNLSMQTAQSFDPNEIAGYLDIANKIIFRRNRI